MKPLVIFSGICIIYSYYVLSISCQGIDQNTLLFAGDSSDEGTTGNSTSILSYVQDLAKPLGFLGVALGSIVTYVLTPIKKVVSGTLKIITTFVIKIKTMGIKKYILEIQEKYTGIKAEDIIKMKDQVKEMKDKAKQFTDGDILDNIKEKIPGVENIIDSDILESQKDTLNGLNNKVIKDDIQEEDYTIVDIGDDNRVTSPTGTFVKTVSGRIKNDETNKLNVPLWISNLNDSNPVNKKYKTKGIKTDIKTGIKTGDTKTRDLIKGIKSSSIP